MADSDYYIGLMSGTSLDGADGVLLDFSSARPKPVVLFAESIVFSPDFKAELLSLNTSGPDELHRAALAANQLARTYAAVVRALLDKAAHQNISSAQIAAIGAHGQTVRHRPPGPGQRPEEAYTLQLNNPALLAELTGLDVVADFRSRDVAAGGQGAPLVPVFHHGFFGRVDATVSVLNLGGISNLSVLPSRGEVIGFDCGPGNALMDAWCQQHTGQAFDAGGQWAASGKTIPALLARLLNEPYLALPPPKSTGRDLFSTSWLAEKLAPFLDARPEDIQNTLTELTARACVDSVNSHGKESTELVVCGGGAFNQHLMQRLQAGLPRLRVSSSELHGLPPLQVEAAAFAWLARQALRREAGNMPSVTGAVGPRILGAVYPA